MMALSDMVSTTRNFLTLLGGVCAVSFTAGVVVTGYFFDPEEAANEALGETIAGLELRNRSLEGERDEALEQLDALTPELGRLRTLEANLSTVQAYESFAIKAHACTLHDQPNGNATLICPFEISRDVGDETLCVFGNGSTEADRSLFIPREGGAQTQPHVIRSADVRDVISLCIAVNAGAPERFTLNFYDVPSDVSGPSKLEVRVGRTEMMVSGQVEFLNVAVNRT